MKYGTLSALDGETLFSYRGDNIDAFMSDTDIPVGIARKILGIRDKKCEGISNRILEYNPEQIAKFIQTVLNAKNEEIERLCQGIIEKHIDGYVFYIYADEKQFQSDFSDLNIKGVYFKKAILKRNAEFGIRFHAIPSGSEDMSTSAHFIPIQEEHSNVWNPI